MQLIGNVEITVKIGERVVDSTRFSNIVTNTGLNWLAESLSTSRNDAITFLAWGSATSTALATNTKLVAETGRKLISSHSTGGTGVHISVCYIGPTEAVGQINELGWFCGSSATVAADSGRLLSRVLYERNKTLLESLTITRTDTFVAT